MKKCYRLSVGMDVSITLEVNLEKLTPELAKEINDFWAGAPLVLEAANGDVVEAAIRRAATRLLAELLSGESPNTALENLHVAEGWPSKDMLEIKITDYEIPDINPDEFEVTALDA